MKKLLFVVSFLLLVVITNSQNLAVEGSAPNLYITHTVAPKENFYSVGRLYNQAPKAIASLNNLAMEKGLAIGQRIKIPLNSQNLETTGNGGSGETASLTRIVSKGENLSKIAADLNVPAQSLKQWNNLSSDNVAAGTPLVVGHLKMSAPSVNNTASNSAVNNPPARSEQKTLSVKVVTSEPKKEDVAVSATIQVSTEKKDIGASQKQELAPQPETKQGVADKEVVTKEPVAKPQTAPESPVKETQVRVSPNSKNDSYSYSNASLSSVEGVFANVFTADASAKSLHTKSGEAATFKSTSGWQDKKYYVLINDVAPGTIVKIQSTEDKMVYAKVLGSMPDMKENTGLMIRMSNAAASYLGIIDPKFPVQISYYQ